MGRRTRISAFEPMPVGLNVWDRINPNLDHAGRPRAADDEGLRPWGRYSTKHFQSMFFLINRGHRTILQVKIGLRICVGCTGRDGGESVWVPRVPEAPIAIQVIN